MTYGLAAALAWGVSTIAAARAARQAGAFTALLMSQLLGAVFLGLVAVVLRPPLAGLHGRTLLGLVAGGLLSLLGWLAYYLALEKGPVGVVSAIADTYGGCRGGAGGAVPGSRRSPGAGRRAR